MVTSLWSQCGVKRGRIASGCSLDLLANLWLRYVVVEGGVLTLVLLIGLTSLAAGLVSTCSTKLIGLLAGSYVWMII